MSGTTIELKEKMKMLSISEMAKVLDDFLLDAENEELSYKEFLDKLIQHELFKREEKQRDKRFKWAAFPEHKTLETFNLSEQQSLSKKQLQQLKELLRIEKKFNLILLGPAGVGKTHLSIGLGIKAIQHG